MTVLGWIQIDFLWALAVSAAVFLLISLTFLPYWGPTDLVQRPLTDPVCGLHISLTDPTAGQAVLIS